MRALLTALAFWVCAPQAHAEDAVQTLTYDLIVNGAVVGHRDVRIHYMEPLNIGDAGSRLIETWTEADARIWGMSTEFQNRSSGHVTDADSNFTSLVSLNGDRSEVQGYSLPDGRWELSGVANGHLSSWPLRRTEVDMSSLDLLDPVRSQHLTTLSTAQVLSVETGTVLRGPVTDLGERTIEIGGESVTVHVWSWQPPEGRFEFAWSQDGLLLDWQANIKGQTVHGRLQEIPPPRSYGAAAIFSSEMPTVAEEEL